MGKTGAEILVDALVREGVKVVFGYPGGCVLDIFDKLNKVKGLKFVLVRHEQGAGHMADGYARASGKAGVVLATSGPGATNLVTALATAYMDSIPVVAITGQVPTHAIGSDAFQEADTVGITRPCTKHNFLVRDVADLPRTIKEAFHIATTGRPGPVLIDFPKDVQKAVLENYVYPETVDIRSYRPSTGGNDMQVRRAAEAIERSKRPLLYCGGGAVTTECQAELVALSERCDIPCTTTLLGLGVFPETHPNAVHMLGMHGTQYANYAMHNTDLIIAVGARFDDRVTGKLDDFAPNREAIIHIDVDPSSISKTIPVTIPIVGDCKQVLGKLLEMVAPKQHPEWHEQIRAWKEQYPLTFPDDDKLRPQYVIQQLYELTQGNAIVTTEVGQHQMWAAHYWQYTRPRTFISSGGLGTMGYGFPAGIGAQMAFPDKLVVTFAGDGSIQMNIQELATAVMEKLPVKVIILNNHYLGMVRQWQQLFYKHNYSGVGLARKDAETGATDYVPNFVKLAEAYGAVGMRVARKEDVRGALAEAMGNGQPTFMEFLVEEEENVWPMIPAGGSVEQMISGMA
jgi:acetolactate synthase-1/2/3 large subunit